MTNADALMWFMLVALAVLAGCKMYSRSAVRRLRSHVARLHARIDDYEQDIGLSRAERDGILEQLEAATARHALTCIDLRRCERKLARARTSRARWQALGAEHERRYRNEFKRADQAEARLMRAAYRAKYELAEHEAGARGPGLAPGVCGRLLVDGQTTCGRCVLPAHEGGQCRLGLRPEQLQAIAEGLSSQGLKAAIP